jgi:hypothetical protein
MHLNGAEDATLVQAASLSVLASIFERPPHPTLGLVISYVKTRVLLI